MQLSGDERANLEARAQERGVKMADVLRGALTAPPPPPAEGPTGERAIELLAREAEAGDVRAQIALARELHPPAQQQQAKRETPGGEFGLRAVG